MQRETNSLVIVVTESVKLPSNNSNSGGGGEQRGSMVISVIMLFDVSAVHHIRTGFALTPNSTHIFYF
jgi:hypothetical protein